MVDISLQTAADEAAIEILMDGAFGTARHSRSVWTLRVLPPVANLSLVLRDGGAILASLRFWEVQLGSQIVLLLGPLAVKPGHDGKGYGVALVETTIKLIKKSKKYNFIVLVGDIDYYRRFNFKQISQPLNLVGPVNPDRVLILNLDKKIRLNKLEKIELT